VLDVVNAGIGFEEHNFGGLKFLLFFFVILGQPKLIIPNMIVLHIRIK
jgi:hypothetical protein